MTEGVAKARHDNALEHAPVNAAWRDGRKEGIKEAQERIRSLEARYRHLHVGPGRICAECGFDLTDGLHERLEEQG